MSTRPTLHPRPQGSLGRFHIDAGVHDVLLRDGSAHRLHEVRTHGGVDDRFLRALELPHGAVRVFDLRRIAPSLAADLPHAWERDRPYLVAYTLRQCFPSGAALTAAVHAVYLMSGVPMLEAATAAPALAA